MRHDRRVTSSTARNAGAPLTKSGRTKEAIATAARELFATQEYAAASVRTIAARAGVDPALVIRYFNSKEDLFLETVAFEGFFSQMMAGPLDGLGERMVRALLGDQRDNFGSYRALMLASGSEQVRRRLQQAIHQMFVEPLAPRLVGKNAELRAHLIAAQLAGIIDAIAILDDQVIKATDSKQLATVYGAALQSLIDPRP